MSLEPNAVTAIDILLDPDATMMKHAQAANARLLKSFSKGYALDESHQPHITCLQRYVTTGNLEEIYGNVSKVLSGEKPTAWTLNAYKYYYLTDKSMPGIGLAGILIEPTEDLIRYQQELIDAVAPFTVEAGTFAAYVTTPDDPNINQPIINYVKTFVPDQTGTKFNPHVSIGVSTEDYLTKMMNENFGAFTFSPGGAAVYHLGNFGTARTKLKGWQL